MGYIIIIIITSSAMRGWIVEGKGNCHNFSYLPNTIQIILQSTWTRMTFIIIQIYMWIHPSSSITTPTQPLSLCGFHSKVTRTFQSQLPFLFLVLNGNMATRLEFTTQLLVLCAFCSTADFLLGKLSIKRFRLIHWHGVQRIWREIKLQHMKVAINQLVLFLGWSLWLQFVCVTKKGFCD